MRTLIVTAIVVILLFDAAISALAGPGETQDLAKVAPDNCKVLLDNEYTRVMDIRLKAGGKLPAHQHPACVIYHFSGGNIRFTSPDGKTSESQFKVGETGWREAASLQAVENIGDAECRVLKIELKRAGGAEGEARLASLREAPAHTEHRVCAPADLKWEAGPASLPAGIQVAMLSGDCKSAGPFAFRAKLPANTRIPPHWHPADENVTVISGSLWMGMGDQFDQARGKEIARGGFALMPAKTRHYAWTKEETEIQVHGIGPWGITYVNPADDPAKAKER